MYRAASGTLASLWHPLVCKSSLAIQFPVQVKGGQLHEMYKGKGTETYVENFRYVMLSDTVAK